MISLVTRQMRARPLLTLLLMGAVALLSCVATIVPRMTTQLDDRLLEASLSEISAVQGDVSASWTTSSIGPPSADPWSTPRETLEGIRASQPEPLRSLLRPAQFVGRQPVAPSWPAAADSGYFAIDTLILIDPDLPSTATLLEGAWPVMDNLNAPESTSVIPVAVVAGFADKAGLSIGDSIADSPFQVAAIFTPNDPHDTRWEHNPYAKSPSETVDSNRGIKLVGGVFVDPRLASDGSAMGLQSPFTFDVFFGLDPTAIAARGARVDTLSNQLTGMLAARYPVSADDEGAPDDDQPLGFHSELSSALTALLDQQRTVHTLITVSAVGPLGVAVAVVWLSAQLVTHRRSAAFALLRARGLSERQLQLMLAGEGAAVGLPAAIGGQFVGVAAIPGPMHWSLWLIALGSAALGTAAMVLVGQQSTPGTRVSVAATPGRWRLLAESLIGLLALAALWRLMTARGSQGTGTDLLGAAAPVLCAMLACVVALRVYPLPLALLHRRFARGPRLSGFLGTARALRNPAGGITPVVTLVFGTTIAVTAATLLGTISAGSQQAVWTSNGSSLHISGPRISAETADRLRAIDGVSTVALLRLASDNTALEIGGEQLRVRVWVSDTDLAQAYSVSHHAGIIPDEVFSAGAPVRIVLGGPDTPTGGTGQLSQVGEVEIAAHLQALPGVSATGAWAFVGAENWPMDPGPATTALIAAEPDADLGAISAAVREIVPRAHVTSIDTELQHLQASPMVSGLSTIFTFLTIVTAVLLTVAILAAQAMSAQERRRDAAVLRTLGADTRQLRALTGWERGPALLIAVLIGLTVGIALAVLMLATLDFRALTGGVLDPPLVVDPLWVGGVCLGLLLASGATILIGAWSAGRTAIAQELRIGEDR